MVSSASSSSLESLQGNQSSPLSLIDSSVGSSSLDRFIETLLTWYEGKYGKDAIMRAQDAFFESYGKFFDDDPMFHQRMTLFLDRLLFVEPLADSNIERTAFDAYLVEQQHELKNEAFDSLRYSMFEVVRLKEERLSLRDLFVNDRQLIQARMSGTLNGISKGDIFQGLVFFKGDEIILSFGLIYHPSDCRRVVKRSIARAVKQESLCIDAELAQWAKIHLKAQRHPHVRPLKIYQP